MTKRSKKLKSRKAKRTKRPSNPPGFFSGPPPECLPEELPIRAELLNAARDLTCGERQEQYGDPKDNIGRIAALRAVFWKGEAPDEMVTEWGTAMDMLLAKIGRISAAPTDAMKLHKDHYTDAAAYLAIAYELSQRVIT